MVKKKKLVSYAPSSTVFRVKKIRLGLIAVRGVRMAFP